MGNSRSSPFQINVSLPSAEIATLSVVDSGSGAGRPVAIGIPFGEGVLASTQGLEVRKPNGAPIPTQWNSLATWRTSGNVLHGVLTFLTPDAGNNSGSYQIRRGTPASGSAVTKAEIANFLQGTVIETTISGTVWSLDLEDLLTGSTVPSTRYLNHTHITGPLMSEYAIGGPLRNGNSEHPHLSAYFYVRGYKEGGVLSNASVFFCIEYTGFKTVTTTTVSTQNIVFKLKGNIVKQKGNFSIQADRRYLHEAWVSDPEIFSTLTPSYLQSTKLVSNYRTDITIQDSLLNTAPQSVDWHDSAGLPAAMGSGGAKDYLAPRDKWTAAYIISGDPRAYKGMLSRAEAYDGWMNDKLSKAYHYRDEATGYVPDVTSADAALHAPMRGGTAGQGNTLPFYRQSTDQLKNDHEHLPNGCYVPYIVTGMYRWLEAAQFSATHHWWGWNTGGSQVWPRENTGESLRAIAWNYRNIVDAAVATPDVHPRKAALDAAVSIASIASWKNNIQPDNNLGIWYTFKSVVYSSGIGIAPWQHDFWIWALLDSAERGYASEIGSLANWAATNIGERYGAGAAYCWQNATPFSLRVYDAPFSSGGQPLASTWAELHAENFGNTTCAPVGGGSISPGRDDSPTDGVGQSTGALALAVQRGLVPVEAWQRYIQRQKPWNDSQFGTDNPENALEPRL